MEAHLPQVWIGYVGTRLLGMTTSDDPNVVFQ
jgi:hypothetical protein